MLVDSSTHGIDLNNAGVGLQGVDILLDIPLVISIARVRYENGTRLEFSYCNTNSEHEDIELARSMVPSRAVTLRGWPSNTLACGHDDEYTTAYWVFE